MPQSTQYATLAEHDSAKTVIEMEMVCNYVCCMYVWLAVWHSGRVIWQMNKVTLRQGQLVLGWVTVFYVTRQLDQLSQHLCVVAKLI